MSSSEAAPEMNLKEARSIITSAKVQPQTHNTPLIKGKIAKLQIKEDKALQMPVPKAKPAQV